MSLFHKGNARKGMLKILKLRFNRMWTKHFSLYKLDSEKAEEPDYIANIRWKNQGNSRKTSTGCLC